MPGGTLTKDNEGRAYIELEEIMAENFPTVSKGVNKLKKLDISQAECTQINPYQDTAQSNPES